LALQDPSDNPKVFVLERELNEVHLLLDNISSNPDNHLPITSDAAPPGLTDDWLTKVCQIDWPPSPTDDKAAEASLLIKAKDYLNTLAAPASGATIAFTLLVTQDVGRLSRHTDQSHGSSPSRSSLAANAYPDLIPKARHFRRIIWWLSLFLTIWLVMTCVLSWYVAYGNSALNQLAAAETAYDSSVKKVEDTEVPPKPDGSAQGAAKASTLTPATATVSILPAETLCGNARDNLKVSTVSAVVYGSVTQLQACEALEDAHDARRAACVQLTTWLWPWTSSCGPEDKTDYAPRASARAAIWGNGVLPVFYGILGAGAAIVRSLSRKMKYSLLTPRDLNISLQQLALGAVTGACIVLFFALPAAGNTASTNLGPVALSSSGISFIAGFGVDAVFTMLEGIISRIFNIAPTAGPAAGTSPGTSGK
jgi:hypothetical protein